MTEPDAQTTIEDVPDEIRRSIHIDADARVVWEIIAEPGWFINEGSWAEHEITTDGDVARVVDPVHGEFSLRTVTLEPPHRAVFEWLSGQAGEIAAGDPVNTVEFTVEPDGTGVLLTVRETGFAALHDDAVVRRRRFEENSEGWVIELGLARDRAEARM